MGQVRSKFIYILRVVIPFYQQIQSKNNLISFDMFHVSRRQKKNTFFVILDELKSKLLIRKIAYYNLL